MREKEIDTVLDSLELLRSLSQAYAEIASVRMQSVRKSVLVNRDFFSSIREIFEEVLSSYGEEIKRLQKLQNRGGEITFLAHNGLTVAVLFSANTGLYGDIIQRVFSKFLNDVRNNDVEVTIVGRMGRLLFTQAEPNRPFTYFDLPDYGAAHLDSLKDLTKHLVAYEQINLYYGQFHSFIKQEAISNSISAALSLSDATSQAGLVRYIFEPDIETILSFFETEIFASIVDQAVFEGELAKLASRAYSMDRAEQRISEEIKKTNIKKLQAIHVTRDKKQRDILSSVYVQK